MSNGLARLNAMNAREARAAFMKACGSRAWAESMTSRRPFTDSASLLAAADAVADALSRDDWLEAFSHHPRIGETNLTQPKFAPTSDMSRREQSGMARASDETRAAFAEGNRAYQTRFGHVFLICATGKSGDEMLAQLRVRLANDAATELRNAAAEQRKITRLRLERMLSE